MKVLIADDDSDLRTLMAAAVERAGFEVAAAVGDGVTAWAYLKTNDFDLAILDIAMPGLTGLEIVSRMRADNRLRLQRVLIVTADVHPSTADIVRSSGVQGMVTKPFRVRDLIQAIHEAVKNCE